MMNGILEDDELSAVKVLAFFFFQIRHLESAIRAVKAILAMYPKDLWARAMIVRCFDASEKYQQVVDVTDDMIFFNPDPEIKKSMGLLRARALQKLGRNGEARKVVSEIGKI
ncbi:MAG: hypothetical protein ACI4NE_05815 [Succinivibrio sp.]